MFTQDFVLNRVSIRGEISNCKYHSSGHIYFSMKDGGGAIACVMFASARRGLAFRLSDGMQVVAEGAVNVYERDGKYQLYVNRIRMDGAGALYERFLALKQELEEMGMFAPEYKKPLPALVKRLGVVTAPTGAAIQDIINISKRRNPGIQLVLYPAKVQGEGAALSIAEGIRALDALGLDAMIVGRGGGSAEDLWAFNEEIVARAVFDCQTPVISAVGHETDTTIIDFVADLRAPTPSAAAELAVLNVAALEEKLRDYEDRLSIRMDHQLQYKKQKLQHLQARWRLASPAMKLENQKHRTGQLSQKYQAAMIRILRENKNRPKEQRQQLDYAMKLLLEKRKAQMAVYIEKMKGLSPLDRLAAGYAVVTNEQRERINSVKGLSPQEKIDIFLSDGKVTARVD